MAETVVRAHYEGDGCPPDGHAAEATLAREAGFPVQRKPIEIGGPPVAVTDLATIIGTVIADPSLRKGDEASAEMAAIIDAFAQQLEADRLPSSIVRLQAMKKVIDRVLKVWEQRYEMELGGVDYFDETGEQWIFAPGSSRMQITDPVGLITELFSNCGVSVRSIAECVTKAGFRITDLRKLADAVSDPERKQQIKTTIDEYAKRESGPKHLTLRDA